jgi:hypothetical protein
MTFNDNLQIDEIRFRIKLNDDFKTMKLKHFKQEMF